MEYILLFLQEHQTSSLDRFGDLIETSIGSGMCDALPEVRSNARQSFRVLHRHWPDRAQRIFSKLDGVSQKYLFDEYSNEEKETIQMLQRPSSASSASSRPSQIPKSKATTSVRPSSVEIPTKRQHDVALHNTHPIAGSKIRSAPVPRAAERSPKTQESTEKSTSTSTLMLPPPAKSVRRDESIAEPLKSMSAPPQTAKRVMTGELMVLGRELMIIVAPTETPSSAIKVPQRVLRPETLIPTTPSASRQPSSVGTVARKTLSDPNSSLQLMLQKSGSTLWSTRVESLQDIKMFMLNSHPSEVVPSFEKIMTVVLSHISDAHFQVVQASLDCLLELLPLFVAPIQDYLDRLLPLLFVKFIEKKEKISDSANRLLDFIMITYHGDITVPLLLKIADQSPSITGSKIKTRCIEYCGSLVTKTCNYFKSGSRILYNLLMHLFLTHQIYDWRFRNLYYMQLINYPQHYDKQLQIYFVNYMSLNRRIVCIR